MSNRMKIDLDRILRAQSVSDDEIGLWPENRLSTLSLRDDLLKRFGDIRNGALSTDETAKTIVDVIRFFWIRLILSLTYSQRMADSLSKADMDLNCEDRYPTLWALMSRSPLPDDRFLPMLASGPPRYAKWRWPLRMLRQAVKAPVVRASPWRKFGRDGDVVSLVQGALVDQLASERGLRPRYSDLDVWFDTVDVQARPRHSDIAAMFMDATDQATAAYGTALRSELRDWLSRQFELSVVRLDEHAQLLRGLSTIPTELWIGSSSSFWPRLLAKEVMARGGKVATFDHGFGSGYFDGVDVPYSMQPFCNEFVTSAGVQAEHIQRFFRAHPIPGQTGVEVIALPAKGQSKDSFSEKRRRPFATDKPVQTVMMLPLPLMGELFNLTPYPDDWWVQDLNRRLLLDLRAMGFKVLVKPHPEFESSELAAIALDCGADMIEGRFEDRAHLADAVLFTHPLTTTMRYAIENRLPSVLIDFGFIPWRPAMRAHLESEVAMISGRVGRDNRLHYDENGLQDMLHRRSEVSAGLQ